MTQLKKSKWRLVQPGKNRMVNLMNPRPSRCKYRPHPGPFSGARHPAGPALLPGSWRRCLRALRRFSRYPVILFTAFSPAYRASRPALVMPRPVRSLLQAGRNEGLERRLRWSRICRHARAADAGRLPAGAPAVRPAPPLPMQRT